MRSTLYFLRILFITGLIFTQTPGREFSEYIKIQNELRHVKFNDGKQPYGGGVEFGKIQILEI